MKTRTPMTCVRSLAVLLALSLAACSGDGAVDDAGRAAATTTTAESGVHGLVVARPFTLARGYVHDWRADGGLVTEGWLLVLDVDPSLVVPRDEYEPILFAGSQTLERVNSGHHSGRVVAVLPADVDVALETLPMWFGAPGLPEVQTAVSIADARRAAEAEGVAPFGAGVVAEARAAGGEALALPSRDELHRAAARMILEHCPDDAEFATGLLAPVVR